MGKKEPRGGMNQEILVEFFKETVEGIMLMNRRQRWQLRRDLKDVCRMANARWPLGKGEGNEPA